MLTKLTTILSGSLLLSFAGLACAADPLSNYTMTELQWDMPIIPGDVSNGTVTVTGTVEDAIAQMEVLYPGWNQTFQSRLPPPATDDEDDTEDGMVYAAADELESFNCNIEGDKIGRSVILTGISYLRGLEGTTKPKNGPGPGNCGRVSCSWNGAIFWCNDNNVDKEVTWGGIADGAQIVADKCRLNPKRRYVRGQAFYKEKWNVIVRRDPC
ncbi:hypothetical protein QBC41DRAFT_308244 [Cercophora samala]|uniref:Uncharacterized protein n=1 Tax=Cercophora samala TaxID=330535 RepID=A0AA39YTF6_9PEZI|nr:hypothetical protein QBC41DRAFT_308244 [Cercophora samala]